MVSLTDTDGMNIFTMMETVGDYDEDQMMFDFYDNDSNGLIEWEEFLNTLQQANQDMGVEPLDNSSITLFYNLFMLEDADGDGALDFDEFMSYMAAMNGDDSMEEVHHYDHCVDSDDGLSSLDCWTNEMDVDGDGNPEDSDSYWNYECEQLADGTWECTTDHINYYDHCEDDEHDSDLECWLDEWDTDNDGFYDLGSDGYMDYECEQLEDGRWACSHTDVIEEFQNYDNCVEESGMYECWNDDWVDSEGNVTITDDYELEDCSELEDGTWDCFVGYVFDNDEEDDFEMLMMMLDTNGDMNISLSEMLVMADGMDTMYTNIFNHNDFNGDGMLDSYEFSYFFAHMNELDSEVCADVKAGDPLMEDGWLIDADDYEIEVMAGDSAAFDGEYCYEGPISAELMVFMADADGDGEVSLTELLALMNNGGEPADEMSQQMTQLLFESVDGDQSSGLNDEELEEFFNIMDSGEEFQPSPSQIMSMWDADGDGSVSLAEVIAYMNTMNTQNGDETLSDVEQEWTGIAFMMSDADGNELLDEDEFSNFYHQMMRNDDHHSDDGHDEHNDHGNDGETGQFICYDMQNHTVMMQYANESDCVEAGYMWANMNDRPGHDGGDDDREEDFDIQFESSDVRFEQWNDESMELVIVQLAVVHNPEEIARLVAIADAEYGNNDSMLDDGEVEMLKGLYALSLNLEEMSEGLSLDGANGTTVDFWVDVDGLLEGEDVVYIRVGTVIEFPTSAYDTSTAHTFVVDNNDDRTEGICHDMSTHTNSNHGNQADCEAAGLMWMADSSDENGCNSEEMIWIHNSRTWNLDSTTGFTFEETNNAWYANGCDLEAFDVLTFTLLKAENAVLPTPESEDWTWDEEDMNMFPVCAWKYSANFADNTSVKDAWMDEAPESGDYEIVLVDDAAYEIFVSCWDPEGGKMIVEITSAVGNSSNTSIGEAMGHIAFKLPAGTSGNVTFDVTWTDGHHTESGTLTVYATGEGDTDLSEVDVEEASGVLPGFTAGLGVLAMLGAAMLAGRRNNA
jgi:Ca2+-binding EF-hand superfamily protein